MTNCPRWTLESFAEIDLASGGVGPFIFNPIQVRYYEDTETAGVLEDYHPKSRKEGHTRLVLALQWHSVKTRPGFIARAFFHDAGAAEEAKEAVDQIEASVMDNLRTVVKDPFKYLPKARFDNRRELTTDINSRYALSTAEGRAVGQSDVAHDLYLAEYAHWANARKVRLQIKGSIPPALREYRVRIDTNAPLDAEGGIGTDAYKLFTECLKNPYEQGGPVKLVFNRWRDYPTVYPPDVMAAKEADPDLKGDFSKIYPDEPGDMWVQPHVSCFNWADIDAAAKRCEGKYLVDVMAPYYIGQYEVAHGIDNSEGYENSDFQCMKSRALVNGVWREIEPPIYGRWPAHAFADMCWKRWVKWGGLAVIERNMGHVILDVFQEKGKPDNRTCRLYKDKDPADPHNAARRRPGLFVSPSRKRTMISRYQRILENGEHDLPDAVHREELKTFQWLRQVNKIAGAPDKGGFHDDVADADIILFEGVENTPTKGYAVKR